MAEKRLLTLPSILIVSDAAEDRAVYQRHLSRGRLHRYEIAEAASGESALKICRRRMPDCLLLDFQLSDLNGLEVLRSLVADPGLANRRANSGGAEAGMIGCGVVFLTGSGDAQLAVEAMKCGAHDYIEKDWITPELLRRAVANAIEKAAMQRELAEKNLALEQQIAELKRAAAERQKAEEKLRESESRLKLALSAARSGAWEFDPRTSRVQWSEEMYALFGQPPNSFRPTLAGWIEWMHPEDRPRAEAVIANLRESGGEFGLEYRTLWPDGRERWMDTRGVALRDDRGATVCVAGVTSDITSRKRAEQTILELNAALDQRVNELQKIFDASPIGLAIAEDPECRRVRANAVLQKMLRLSPDASLARAAPPADYKVYRDGVEVPPEEMPMRRSARLGLAVYDDELELVLPSGVSFTVINNVEPLLDEAGRPRGAISCVTDITERKRIENTLRESEERYRNIIETANEGVWLIDAEARTLYLNQRMAAMLGDEPDEMLGRQFLEFCFDEDRAEAFKRITGSLIGQRQSFDFRFRRKDGGELLVLASTSPALNAEGEIAGALGLFTDVTLRRQAEEELRRALAILETICAGTPDLIYVKDLDGRLVMANPATLRALGRGEAEVINHTDAEFQINDEDAAEMMATDRRIMTTGAAEILEETVELPGGPRVFLSTKSPYFDQFGEIVGLIGISTDITERKQLEIERELLLSRERAAREFAEAASRSKDEFLAVVSHELRSPLNAMLGWARILKKGKADAEMRAHAIDVIERSARQQQALIEDLLDTARIISGKLRLETQPVYLRHAIEEAADVVSPAAEAKGLSLHLDLDSEDEVTGDPDRLQQVIWNLLSNAVKFTPEGGRVEVKLRREGWRAQITVSDTGQGIKPDALPFIFDRFRQADGSTTRRFGGLGLGLSLARHLAELHGGEVSAESAGEGLGATFTLKLPVRAVRAFNFGLDTARWNDQPLTNPRLLEGVWALVVDDEADARDLVAAALEQHSARVTVAASAAEALAALGNGGASARPSVLVSDISMPDEDGYTLIERVRSLAPDQGGRIPAVALTANESPGDRVRALAAGFQTHVAKPVEPEELALVIASLTGRAGLGVNAVNAVSAVKAD